MKLTVSFAAAVAVGAGLTIAPPVAAADVVALTGERDLVLVDTTTMVATGMTTVTGDAGRLLGIDVRPADGMLYGVFESGTVATIDPLTGAASPVSTLSVMLPAGVVATVDFNPVADRLRLMGSDGTSLRVNVDTGETIEDGRHTYAGHEATPEVIAGAYTNSYAGTTSTALFNLDAATGWLVLQDPPNDGTLNPVGELGIAMDEVGFDILADGNGGNEAWLLSGGVLYAIDLETGMASEVGPVDGAVDRVRDLAILPAM